MPTPILVDLNGVTNNSNSANSVPSHNSYHFSHLGSLWCVIGKTGRYFEIFNSTDGGNTWTQQDSANSPGPFQSIGLFWDGSSDTLYCWGSAVTTNITTLNSFDMSTALFGGAIGSNSPALGAAPVYLIQKADTTFRLYYGGATDTTLAFRNFDGASTWSAENVIATGTSAQYVEFIPQGDVAHIIYYTASSYKYIRVAGDGSLSSAHTFTEAGLAFGGSGLGTSCDGVIETTGDFVAIPASVTGPDIVMLRATPTSAPVWQAAEVIDATNNFAQAPTMVLGASGEEIVYWMDQSAAGSGLGLTTQSAIYSSVNFGVGWAARVLFYDIAVDPYSDPDPANCISDRIYNIGLAEDSGDIFVHFDGASGNFAGGAQPNFGFGAIVPPPTPPTCSLSGSPLGINPGDTATLSWTTTNTPTTASIDNGVGNVNPNGGSVLVAPTVTTTYILTVTNADGSSTCQVTISVGILGPSCGGAPSGRVGVAYSATFTSTGGTPPYTFAIGSGSLPFGLTLASDGTVSGTPTQAGVFFFTISVTDSNGVTGSVACNIPIAC